MTEPYGTAKVVQQGGDLEDVVEEAIDCCPNDCIHKCTRSELELLEEHRSHGYIDDLLASFHLGGRLTSEGEGGKGMAIPHWKDPITHQVRTRILPRALGHCWCLCCSRGLLMWQGWRKGDKYVKTRRLRMTDPLLHKSGERTRMGLIGLQAGQNGWQKASPKVNEAPSPTNQDGHVIPSKEDMETPKEYY